LSSPATRFRIASLHQALVRTGGEGGGEGRSQTDDSPGFLVLNLELIDKNEAQTQQLQIQTRELATKDAQMEAQLRAFKFYEKFAGSYGFYCARKGAQAVTY